MLLTHANLLANIEAIGRGLDVQPTDVGVSWLPLYHDMGLIGTWLFCQTKGMPIAIQSPLSFLARPERWLWTIHERRATLSAAPNFAYELCARKIKDEAIEGLDLSSWRCALNGAEPVSPETLERFTARFSRLRVPARGHAARLRPGRELGGRRLPAAGPRAADRPRRPRPLRDARAAPWPPATATRRPCVSSPWDGPCPSTR